MRRNKRTAFCVSAFLIIGTTSSTPVKKSLEKRAGHHDHHVEHIEHIDDYDDDAYDDTYEYDDYDQDVADLHKRLQLNIIE